MKLDEATARALPRLENQRHQAQLTAAGTALLITAFQASDGGLAPYAAAAVQSVHWLVSDLAAARITYLGPELLISRIEHAASRDPGTYELCARVTGSDLEP